eukprot:GHVS01041082.1.p2 GENE.GHVS01041082.1~~GHVS01041082.1.p2  ORF type:complete len:180 (-),score=43.14 GHVS01041082.1:73-612(-)
MLSTTSYDNGCFVVRKSQKQCCWILQIISFYFLFSNIFIFFHSSFANNNNLTSSTTSTSTVHFFLPSLPAVYAVAPPQPPPPPSPSTDSSPSSTSYTKESHSAASTVGRNVSKEEENVFLSEFREYDLNSDDLLDAHELRAMHSDVEPAEIIQFFHNVDLDDTGTITFNEYLDYITTLS